VHPITKEETEMKELQESIGQLIFWSIVFAIVLVAIIFFDEVLYEIVKTFAYAGEVS
jgi:hypothetical protein